MKRAIAWFAENHVAANLLMALLLVGALAASEWLVLPWVVAGDSMSPTLRAGDRVLVDLWSYRQRPPRRGEVALLLEPGGEPLVKRVARLPPGADRRAGAKAAEWADLAVGADLDVGLDHGVGTDNNAICELRAGIDDCGWVNRARHQPPARADIISASHTTSSLTSARPLIFAKVLLLATSSTSKMI